MSAKILTALVTAAALTASLTVATPVAALDQDERNVVGGIVLGVLGTLAVQQATKPKTRTKVVTCSNPFRTMRNGQIVWACR
ncbi:hypothetical protein [Sagittula salina]|uniref:17 kDa surface antigen n=1 Tax=Sagittula salina TaxID=2820268 RepID=A0A940RYI9_9RHOB|nr:hypothetical protein [Sagittula salina]MBP0480918.1 hypothetical protein [Sagittula salina]